MILFSNFEEGRCKHNGKETCSFTGGSCVPFCESAHYTGKCSKCNRAWDFGNVRTWQDNERCSTYIRYRQPYRKWREMHYYNNCNGLQNDMYPVWSGISNLDNYVNDPQYQALVYLLLPYAIYFETCGIRQKK